MLVRRVINPNLNDNVNDNLNVNVNLKANLNFNPRLNPYRIPSLNREGVGRVSYIFKIMKNINWKKIVEFAIAMLTALLGVLGANAMR